MPTALFLLSLLVHAEPDADLAARKILEPRHVSLQGIVSLAEALKKLQNDTGNEIVDRRKHRDNPQLSLDWKNQTFFQALDDLVRKANAAYSLTHEEGGVSLVDGTMNRAPVYYHGLFRCSIKKIGLILDHAVADHACQVTLEIAWEPRFEPFYLDQGTLAVRYSLNQAAKRIEMQSPGSAPVAGRLFHEVDYRFPAPPRSVEKIDQLDAQVSLLGPSKMLVFSFHPLSANEWERKRQEDVEVGVRWVPQLDQAKVLVEIRNPPGTPAFESYQSWLGNNRLWLEKKLPEQRIVEPLPHPQENDLQSRQASLEYLFGKGYPRQLQGWTLNYRTPARMMWIQVPMQFKNLPLP